MRSKMTTKNWTKTGLDQRSEERTSKQANKAKKEKAADRWPLAIGGRPCFGWQLKPSKGTTTSGRLDCRQRSDSDPCTRTKYAQWRDRQRRRGPAEDDQPHQLPPRPGRRCPVPRSRRLARPRAVSSFASLSPWDFPVTCLLMRQLCETVMS